MAAGDKEQEDRLAEVANALLSPPSSVNQLLPLIKILENCLLRVTQSPCASMQRALGISMTALLNKELFDHKNTFVRVYVASCLIEMTRITAPYPPSDDTIMKEILRLIVDAFDNLCDISHCLYEKRVAILKQFSKFRLFHIMGDLQCHDLILDMFKLFLNNIREHHPDDVYSTMGFIMILVVEESDKIPLELVSTLLDFVRKENKEVFPKAWKLAKRVIDNCSLRLAPCMFEAVKHKGFPLKDYSKLVAFICKLKDPSHYGSSEEDDLGGPEEVLLSLENCSSEVATLGKHASLRVSHLGAENHSAKSAASIMKSHVSRRNSSSPGAENHSAKSAGSNMKSQESRRSRMKNKREVSSSKANVGPPSTAESRQERRVNSNHESVSDLIFLDDSESNSA